jgi:hypothetical protein
MPEQKYHVIHIDAKVKSCKDADLKAKSCPACKFDGKLPILKDGTPVFYTGGFTCEAEEEIRRVQTKTDITITFVKLMHCPACGFWDRESIQYDKKIPIGGIN